ncbi:YjbH domain-containing protein [Alcanivorax sp. 1008]|uniref:YjbH domain-containing protein n=1 Tax=Alcanivorax sp. 1008 TaxID=2816853 RepID=UPI001D3FE199|nr:YjbH domain-containing protein [Alcanivorax sp. 1008]MCC1496263.1 YjbH domain-containing protein [Alcanivorax sp. 1008]
MKKSSRFKPLLPVIFSLPYVVSAADDLALPGYSGFLNVPSATVLNHVQADVQYSDQAWVAGEYGHYRNVAGVVGIFPLVEVGGRIAWEETQSNLFANGSGPRDLSANFKVQAPLIPESWFTLAAGAQDFGGSANNFESYYVVAGRQFGPVEMAVGYGRPEEALRYLDGAFAAISYRPTRWLNLIAEYDAADVRLGAGLTSPKGWLPGGLQVKGKVMAYDRGDSDNGRQFFSLGLSIPLGRDTARSTTGAASAVATEAASAPVTGQESKQLVDEGAATTTIGEILVAAGYERVSVGSAGNQLTVRFENNLFNRDERQALEDVAQRLHAAGLPTGSEAATSLRLVLLNQNIPVMTRQLWLDGEQPRLTSASEQEPPQQWDFQGSAGPVWRPRLTLSPNLTTGVATEYGVLDTSLALGSEVSTSLWTGALASATWNQAVYASEDFDRGGVFYNSRQRTGLKEADLQQTLRLHPQFFTTFHAGRYNTDYYGWLSDSLLVSSDRRHALGFLSGNFRHVDDSAREARQMLGRYTYSHPGRDVQLTLHAGEFFEGDTGFRVDGRFWFGDYAMLLTYKNTDAEFVGLGVMIPLTPVKDRQFRYLQVRGNPDWSYTVQTRINEDANVVSFGGATIVRPANTLERVYLNRLRPGL